MPHLRKAGLMALAFFTLTLGSTLTARADIVTFTSFGDFQSAANAAGVLDIQNVLTPGTATGLSVPGFTNQTNTQVNVSSNTALTVSEANGQARFAGANDTTFNQFTVSLQGNTAFRALAFNLNETTTCTQQNPCTLQFGVTGTALGAGEGTQTITYTGGSGFIGFLALGNQRITSVTLLSGGVTLNNISQVRVGGIAAVPEPMTMLLFGTGLAGIAARARRRRKA